MFGGLGVRDWGLAVREALRGRVLGCGFAIWV